MPHLNKLFRKTLTATGLVLGLAAAPVAAQFSSGSDGSFGPIDAQADMTIQLPPDGIINATTVNVATGITLTFQKNALNTPVFLLAQDNVTIDGTIDVSGNGAGSEANGTGGPGGFDGGASAGEESSGEHGLGPGGGQPGDNSATDTGAGGGSFGGTPSDDKVTDGPTYGNVLLMPLIGGSGGGGGITAGGGGGGGAILVASDTEIIFGSNSAINSIGGGTLFGDPNNEGSGGAIRLVAPRISGGRVTLNVSGGAEASGGSSRGGHGRIRIDALDLTALSTDLFPNESGTMGSVMVAIPDLPTLNITNAAGTDIPTPPTSNVTVMLPPGSSTTQPITVQASGFGTLVPIDVVVTPATGAQVVVQGSIDNTATDPASTTVNVDIPVDVPVDIAVRTR